ncbi:hypothetical protein F0562_034674 [Nyssa sinensis]|uniref:Uncharacterized protein n=1 Tax=Nyssa sinensis TaxID=561372 RepID=A0A5J5AAB1_9ASTE|nr:hypothetical protein F0562_034674 [Nyssa sinensis]
MCFYALPILSEYIWFYVSTGSHFFFLINIDDIEVIYSSRALVLLQNPVVDHAKLGFFLRRFADCSFKG